MYDPSNLPTWEETHAANTTWRDVHEMDHTWESIENRTEYTVTVEERFHEQCLSTRYTVMHNRSLLYVSQFDDDIAVPERIVLDEQTDPGSVALDKEARSVEIRRVTADCLVVLHHREAVSGSAGKTPGGLSRWTDTDVIDRRDFNIDNREKERLLAGCANRLQLLADAIDDLDLRKADKEETYTRAELSALLSNRAFSIPVSAWLESKELDDFPMEATISVQGIAPADSAVIRFSPSSAQAAHDVGISAGTAKVVNGAVKLFSLGKPTAVITGSCSMVKAG